MQIGKMWKSVYEVQVWVGADPRRGPVEGAGWPEARCWKEQRAWGWSSDG